MNKNCYKRQDAILIRVGRKFRVIVSELLVAVFIAALATANVQAVELPTGFADELVAGGFDTPVAMAALPDGKVLILEQYNGKVFLLDINKPAGRSLIYEFADVNTSGGNERGLLGVAEDPNFDSNGYLYFYYTAKGGYCQITRLTFGSSDSVIAPESRLGILADIPDKAWNHNGGTLRFGPDSMLYVSIGDDASSCLAQDIKDLRGSILRLDVRLTAKEEAQLKAGDYSALVASDNPFSDYEDSRANLIYVFGLRNPFRFNIDPQNGDLMIADVGLLDFEEIDYVPYASGGDGGGANFGWPFFEGPAPRAEPNCQKSRLGKYIQPVAYYDRIGFVASVISLCIYRPITANGEFAWPEEYFGDYFYTDYFQGFIRRLKKNKRGDWISPPKVLGQEKSLNWAIGLKSIPDAFVGADGALYYLRQFDDSFNPQSGQLRRIIYK